ncbi:glycosyltransferase family 4 protein [Roseateles noduli]|uniref:glycosyltransferase family 4 protein n=1 Tax=Roseateles noduli TaxID=2052484 RepID=UPI003D64730D
MGLKIGIDATALVAKPTGVGNYIRALLEPMVDAHPEAEFILFSNEEVAFPSRPNVRTRVSQPKRRGPYWQNTQLRLMLSEERPHTYWATNGLLPLLRPRGMGTVLTVHDLVYKFAPETLPTVSLWGRRLGQQAAVRAADRVVVVSNATGVDAALAYRRTPDAVIPPLADPIFERPTRAVIEQVRHRLGLSSPYLLTLGTLEPRKNLVRLLDAYLRRRRAGVPLPTLALAGGKGWLDDDIGRLLAQGEASGHVKRLGYVALEDLPALYAGCDAFVMPSIYEGFGMPLLEAQLCGAAVIHGPHISMREAAGELGAITPVDTAGIEGMLDQLAAGELAVNCRLPGDIVNDATVAADRLWHLLMETCGGATRP